MSKALAPVKPALLEGTLVTVVFPDHCLLTRVVQVIDGQKSDPIGIQAYWFRVACDGSPTDILQVADEGISWLRGHHMPSSREVEAAVAAEALRAPEPAVKTGQPTPALGGFGDILLGALAGAAGAMALRSVKTKPGAMPTRVYKKR